MLRAVAVSSGGSGGSGAPVLPNTPSSAGTLTLTAARHYAFSGTTATWTMPLLSASLQNFIYIKNRGSGQLTLVTQGSDFFWDASAVTSIVLNPGTARILYAETYWDVE